MATNNFPRIGKKKIASKRDFYQKLSVTATDFGSTSVDGYQPDIMIPFSTVGIALLNEGTSATQVVEYSFDGITVHGELDPTLSSKGMMFDNRTVCLAWFRIKSGSTGPVTIRIDAWG
jgi:hypothetical protein